MFEHEFLEQVPAYALGALSRSESEPLEQHLKRGCDVCEAELAIFQETSNRLAFALPDVPLPAGLKQKVNSRIDQIEQTRPADAPRMSVWRVAAAVALFAIAGSLVWKERSDVNERDQQIAGMAKQLEEQRAEITWLRDPAVQLAMLTGLADAPGAHGKMIWNAAASKGMFYADTLPPLATGKSYQLWVIGSQGPVSAGVFEPNQQGTAVVTIIRIAGPASGSLQFAVTIEPRGGLPKPSGTMVLAGKPL